VAGDESLGSTAGESYERARAQSVTVDYIDLQTTCVTTKSTEEGNPEPLEKRWRRNIGDAFNCSIRKSAAHEDADLTAGSGQSLADEPDLSLHPARAVIWQNHQDPWGTRTHLDIVPCGIVKSGANL
jgi:hypothetical protein